MGIDLKAVTTKLVEIGLKNVQIVATPKRSDEEAAFLRGEVQVSDGATPLIAVFDPFARLPDPGAPEVTTVRLAVIAPGVEGQAFVGIIAAMAWSEAGVRGAVSIEPAGDLAWSDIVKVPADGDADDLAELAAGAFAHGTRCIANLLLANLALARNAVATTLGEKAAADSPRTAERTPNPKKRRNQKLSAPPEETPILV